jgi:uncharacterized membrane protein
MTDEKKTVAVEENDNILAAAATIPIVGLVIYFAMKDASDFVKYYAKHGIGLLVVGAINFALAILFFIPFIGWILSCLSWIFSFVLIVIWVYLAYSAFQNTKVSIPILTDMVNKVLK